MAGAYFLAADFFFRPARPTLYLAGRFSVKGRLLFGEDGLFLHLALRRAGRRVGEGGGSDST